MNEDHVLEIEADEDFEAWAAREAEEFPVPELSRREVAEQTVNFLFANPCYAEFRAAVNAAPAPGAGLPFTDEQRDTVLEAVAAARTHGRMRLPRVLVRFHAAFGGALGLTSRDGSRVDLLVTLDRDQLRRTVLHELQHAVDYTCRLPLSIPAEETRADAFAVAVALFAGWGLPQQ